MTAKEELARWHRTGRLLARLPDTVTGGLLTPRLLADIMAIARGDVGRGEYALRVLVLWAYGSGRSRLIEALFAADLPGLADNGVPAAWHLPLYLTSRAGPPRLRRPDHVGHEAVAEVLRHRAAANAAELARHRSEPDRAPRPFAILEAPAGVLAAQLSQAPVAFVLLPVVSPYGRTTAGYSMAATIRDAVAGAHAIVGVAGYDDIVGDRPPAQLGELRDWLTLARGALPADRVTLVVDGTGPPRGDLAVAQSVARLRTRRMLGRPPWQDGAVLVTDSALALLAARSAPGGSRAAANWAASGLPALLDRIVGPLKADPAAMFIASAEAEFLAVCEEIYGKSGDVLAANPTADGRERLPAAQRRARLAALAARPLADRLLADRRPRAG